MEVDGGTLEQRKREELERRKKEDVEMEGEKCRDGDKEVLREYSITGFSVVESMHYKICK